MGGAFSPRCWFEEYETAGAGAGSAASAGFGFGAGSIAIFDSSSISTALVAAAISFSMLVGSPIFPSGRARTSKDQSIKILKMDLNSADHPHEKKTYLFMLMFCGANLVSRTTAFRRISCDSTSLLS